MQSLAKKVCVSVFSIALLSFSCSGGDGDLVEEDTVPLCVDNDFDWWCVDVDCNDSDPTLTDNCDDPPDTDSGTDTGTDTETDTDPDTDTDTDTATDSDTTS